MIDRDDILRMAREAKLPDPMVFYASIERFATMVAAAEREACAQVCEGLTGRSYECDMGRLHSAAAIRARSSKMNARAWGWCGLVWAFFWFWFWFAVGAVALGLIDGWGIVPGLACAVVFGWHVWWFWRRLGRLRDRDGVSRRGLSAQRECGSQAPNHTRHRACARDRG